MLPGCTSLDPAKAIAGALKAEGRVRGPSRGGGRIREALHTAPRLVGYSRGQGHLPEAGLGQLAVDWR